MVESQLNWWAKWEVISLCNTLSSSPPLPPLPPPHYLLSVKLYEAGIRLFCIFMQIASWPASNPTQCAKQISAGTSWSNSISETSEQENHPISQSWKRFDQTRSAKGMVEILAFHDKVQCAGSNFFAIFHKSGKQDLALPSIKPQLWIFLVQK